MLSKERTSVVIRAVLLVAVLVAVVVPAIALGQQASAPVLNYNAQVQIPGSSEQARAIQGNKVVNANLLGNYVVAIYRFGIWLSIFLTIFMMMVGGFLWVIAGGNPSRVENAKSYITSALTGLVVALTSFVILQTVNPALVVFQPIQPKQPTGLTDTGCCCTATAGVRVAACAPSKCATGDDAQIGVVCQKMAGSGLSGGTYDAFHSCLSPILWSSVAHPRGGQPAPKTLDYYGSCDGATAEPESISIGQSSNYCCVVQVEGGGFVWLSSLSAWWYGDQACYDLPVGNEACCAEQKYWQHPDSSFIFNDNCEAVMRSTSGVTCSRGRLDPNLSAAACKTSR